MTAYDVSTRVDQCITEMQNGVLSLPQHIFDTTNNVMILITSYKRVYVYDLRRIFEFSSHKV